MSSPTIVARTLVSGVSEVLGSPADLVLLEPPAPRGNLSWMAVARGVPCALVQTPLVPEATRGDFIRSLARVESLLDREESRAALGERLPHPLAAIEVPAGPGRGRGAPARRFHAWAWSDGVASLPRTPREKGWR